MLPCLLLRLSENALRDKAAEVSEVQRAVWSQRLSPIILDLGRTHSYLIILKTAKRCEETADPGCRIIDPSSQFTNGFSSARDDGGDGIAIVAMWPPL